MSDPIVPQAPVAPVVGTPEPQPAPVAPQVPPQVPSAGKKPPRMPEGVEPPAPKEEPVVPVVDEGLEELQTGDAGLDAAIDAFVDVTGAKSTDLKRAVSNALEYENAELIDKAFLREKFGKHGEQAIKLAEAAVKHTLANAQAAHDSAVQQVYNKAGGEAQWKQAVSVFNSTATPETINAVKALMNNGDVDSGAALVLQTVQNSGLLPQVNPTLNNGQVVNSAQGALTAAEFKTELAALRKEAGNRSLETGPWADKYNTLIQRRTIGKRMGR